MSSVFRYEEALSRTLGWVTELEQQPLRHRKIAFEARGLIQRSPVPVSAPPPSLSAAGNTALMAVLDLARWAPSGDNGQPWRFKPLSPSRVEVQFQGRRSDDIYDVDGKGSLLTLGCLVESLRLAATPHGWAMDWSYQAAPAAAGGTIAVHFSPDPSVAKDALCDFLPWRSVDRRPYRRTALSHAQVTSLEQAVGDEFELVWLDSLPSRWRASRLNAAVCGLVNSTPEGIEITRKLVDFDTPQSPDRIPIGAAGISKLSATLIRWILAKPSRAHFILGALPGSTWCSRIELALIPGLRCACHFLLVARDPDHLPDASLQRLRAGMAIQRLWLTATRLGLAMQPSYGLLSIFHYAQKNESFSQKRASLERIQKIGQGFERLCREHQIQPGSVLFMGRLGTPLATPLRARSTRKPLCELLVPAVATHPCSA